MPITINGTGTITGISAGGLPSATVTQTTLATPVAGTGPAFSAYPSTGQTISLNTITKITLGTEIFDTNSNFASSRFTPTVAGYYQINARFGNGGAATECVAAIYKNGAVYAYGSDASSGFISTVSELIYLNGSTDYVELYGLLVSATAVSSTQERTMFSGVLIRSA